MAAEFITSIADASTVSINQSYEKPKPHVAMVGRSNVGKSSLINHLAGVKGLARTSQKPGLTQMVNLYMFDEGFILADLPGYGFHSSKRSAGQGFSKLIGQYLSNAKQLRGVFLIIDGRRGIGDMDRHAIEQLKEGEIPFTVILNKVDKLKKSELAKVHKEMKNELGERKIIMHSIEESKGLGEIRDTIRTYCRG